ncbi:CBS domain containing protein [Methanonatronarchaeum thermophilum]|uniref:CBS domain containing protein n=1 Tax=Methanonatronarchaeum thermophilum TaxID=1927129 RepID=A0A1Y3GEG5_9EURY|nr:CBS domain-containing protein [Methanonatronarchaeum thermophilum]OUJ18693.1 CBS domain containing protein [Methanonatronarchaeum thermophilum]
METKIPVKEVMTLDVVTVEVDDDVQTASRKMADEGIGSVIAIEEGTPVGIITEKDLVHKVLAKGYSPDKLLVKDVMTRPLVTIEKEEEINTAIKKMRKLKIERLPVTSGKELVGIITSNDIMSISPEIVEILTEAAEIYGSNKTLPDNREWDTTGICNSCNTFSTELDLVEGELFCEQCREEVEAGGYRI